MTNSDNLTEHTTTSNGKAYTVRLEKTYVYLKIHGKVSLSIMENSTNEVVQLAEESGVDKLLDDITDIDKESVSLEIQTKVVRMLWKMRPLKKIAVVYRGEDVGAMVSVVFNSIVFNDRCRAFDNEAEAVAWLNGA